MTDMIIVKNEHGRDMAGFRDYDTYLAYAKAVKETVSNSASTMRDEERRILSEAIRECNGSVYEIVHKLGISRATVYRKVRQFGLQEELVRGKWYRQHKAERT